MSTANMQLLVTRSERLVWLCRDKSSLEWSTGGRSKDENQKEKAAASYKYLRMDSLWNLSLCFLFKNPQTGWVDKHRMHIRPLPTYIKTARFRAAEEGPPESIQLFPSQRMPWPWAQARRCSLNSLHFISQRSVFFTSVLPLWVCTGLKGIKSTDQLSCKLTLTWSCQCRRSRLVRKLEAHRYIALISD